MKIGLNVVGVEDLTEELVRMRKFVPIYFGASILKAAQTLLSWARALTPVDTGRLRLSGKAILSPDRKDATVEFDTHYALYVHEDLNANHPNGGQAKFLEEPLVTRKRELLQIVEGETKKQIAATLSSGSL